MLGNTDKLYTCDYRCFWPNLFGDGTYSNLQLAGSLLNFMYLPVCYLCCERGINVIICMQLGGLEILFIFMSYFYLKKVMSFPFWHFWVELLCLCFW